MELQSIYVLWLRDLKRYVRARSRIIGSLGMPIFFLAFFGMGFRRVEIPSLPSNLTYIDFLAPGIVSMVVLFTSTFSGISIVWDRQFGFLREIMVAPISRTTIALGRTLGGATTALMQGLIMVVLSFFIGFKPSMGGLLLAFVFMFLIAIAFTGIGIAISTFMHDIHGFQIVINFFVFPIFLLSGALFPISELPEFVAMLALLDPLTYGVDGMRWAMIGYSEFNPIYDFLVLLVFCIAIIVVSAYLFNKTEVE
ncbi:multidrug ABC transporter permease [Archaeoglobales archaeon]|nr:MAG: multidrug ABC transporter permease [Archaeoglobales archaeon]